MSVSFRQLHPAFAAEVSGIDCGKALSESETAVIETGMDRYAVLVFPDQKITDEQQLAFTRHFGELENYATGGHIRTRGQPARRAHG
jgi:alpha-ketoglutarate-dependent 2,4-dichlorophenoxyacetate dioxygenase